jgi:gliding motility-associated-like protein
MLRACLIGTTFILLFSARLLGQAPVIQWQKTLGSFNGDYPQSVQQTSDGGYIVGGYTEGPDGDVEGYHGNIVIGDVWLTKLSATGSLQWTKCLGGTYTEVNTYVQQSPDGGYILAASSASIDCGMAPGHGGLDIWLVKLSSAGDIQWQHMFGGSGNEYATSLNPTPDGGYIIGGYTSSSDGQVTGFHPSGSYSFDWWIIKVDAGGNLKWERTVGGSDVDQCFGVALTSDGGCIATGRVTSTDGDAVGNHGGEDAMLVKLDNAGNIQWKKVYGGSNFDSGWGVLTTSDGGYIFSGRTASNNGDVSGNHQAMGSFEDFWVVKTDASGTIQWQKCYGGSANEEAFCMDRTADGGWVIGGSAESKDGDLSCDAGVNDVWIIKIDASGILQWSKSMGGNYYDIAYALQTLKDGSFIVAAETCSTDVPGYHRNTAPKGSCGDYWIIKLSAPGATPAPSISITPAPAVVCAGSPATLSAFVQNAGGVIQSYAWSRNGLAAGSNSPTYTASDFKDGDLVAVAVQTGAGTCDAGGSWVTASTTLHANTNILHPSVKISANPSALCNCTPVNFAVSVTGGGTEPAYQWMINGVIQGTNSESFLSASLKPTDIVTMNYSDSSGCVANAPIVSNSITLAPSTGAPVSVSISGPKDLVCTGSPETFAAAALNAGANPVYQWEVNGGNVGTNSSTYSSAGLANGDVVSCLVTADVSFTCSSGGSANSNPVTVQLAAKTDPSVVVTVNDATICKGDTAIFTAAAQQAGANPGYAWEVNGTAVGASGPNFSDLNAANGDMVQCVVTVDPSYTCSLMNSATSTPLAMQVLNQPPPSVSITDAPNGVCTGGQIAFNAVEQNGGNSPNYQWLINGQAAGPNGPSFASSGLSNGDIVSCRLTPGAGACKMTAVLSNTIAAVVYPLPVVRLSPADTVVVWGGRVMLDGVMSGGAASFEWTPANLLTDPQSLTPETAPLQDSVTFTLTVETSQGCSASADAKVLIYRAVVMPNAFTPNGDGVNDLFRVPPGITLHLTELDVFDRWGMRVFSTKDIGQGWDGSVGGRPAPAGTYVYVLTGTDLKGPVSAKGTVMLVR